MKKIFFLLTIFSKISEGVLDFPNSLRSRKIGSYPHLCPFFLVDNKKVLYNKVIFKKFSFYLFQEGGEPTWQKRKQKRKSRKENQQKNEKRLRKNEDNV